MRYLLMILTCFFLMGCAGTYVYEEPGYYQGGYWYYNGSYYRWVSGGYYHYHPGYGWHFHPDYHYRRR